MSALVPRERIEKTILVIRGHKVMVDADLAELYGVSTKVLNQAVKRNNDRFPKDFIFRLTNQEKLEVVTNCDHLRKLKFSPAQPFAFTEHGAVMVASVLNSKRAVENPVASDSTPERSLSGLVTNPPVSSFLSPVHRTR